MVFVFPEGYWLPKPYLTVSPSTSELGTGYASMALFAVYIIVAAALLLWEFVRDRTQRKSVPLLPAFLTACIVFFILRIASIAVQLNVTRLYSNMMASRVLTVLGDISALGALTLIALGWTKILCVLESWAKRMQVFRVALIVGWCVVSLALLGLMIWFCVTLPRNFGVGAHDGSIRKDNLTYIIGPVNNTLEKPQSGIIMANSDLHYSFMAGIGTYAAYGFVLAFSFLLQSVAILFVVRKIGASLDSSKDRNHFRGVAFRIGLVSTSIMLCYSVIFVFSILEIALHRHGRRYEYYITNFLCAELVAFGILLLHYWYAEVRAVGVERSNASGSLASGDISPRYSATTRPSEFMSSRMSRTGTVGPTEEEEGEERQRVEPITKKKAAEPTSDYEMGVYDL